MAEKLKITPAKGRPMLNWVGKKPLDYVKGFPAQLLEVFDPLETGMVIERFKISIFLTKQKRRCFCISFFLSA